MTEFTVQKREKSGKGVARKLRAQGLIPGICYGANAEPTPVIADPDALYRLLTGEYRTNLVFQLNIEGGDTHSHVMVRDYQVDPVRRDLKHADFVSVDPEKTLTVTVPIVPEGKPKGVRAGGRFQMVRNDVSLSCKPADIPPHVLLDVTDLALGSSISADELDLPAGAEPAYKMNYTVAAVVVPRGLTAEEQAAEDAAAAEAEAAASGDAPAEDAPAES